MIITSSKIITSKRMVTGGNNIGAVVISRGIVQAVGPLKKMKSLYSRHSTLEMRDAVLMPGLVNVHTHLELPALLDAIRAKTFHDWVLNLILAKKNLRQKDYSSAANDDIDIAIKTGTTTVGEICTHGVSPELLKRSHLRATIFQEMISMDPSFPLPHLVPIIPDRSPLIQNGISPHSPYTVSEAALKEIIKISRRKKLRLCMHVAESKEEIKLLQGKKSGLDKLYRFAKWEPSWAPRATSPFEYLNRIGFLSPDLLAVHAVQVSNADIVRIRKSGTAIAHCPRSNKELGVGRMPLKKFLDAGITVGLGTDSLASSPTLTMWEEMRYALKIHKKDGITARDIFEIATIGGAKALGLDKEIGTIEPGKKADVIAVPLPSRNSGDIYSDLLRETNSCIMAMVNGKILWSEPTVSAP